MSICRIWASSKGLGHKDDQAPLSLKSGEGGRKLPGRPQLQERLPAHPRSQGRSQPCGTQGRCPRGGDPRTWPGRLSRALQNGMWRRAFQKERPARVKMPSQPGKCAVEGPTGPAPRDGCREALAARAGRALTASLRSLEWTLGVVETTVGFPVQEPGVGLEGASQIHTVEARLLPWACPRLPRALGAGGGHAELVLPCTQALCLRVSQLPGSLCDRRAPHATPLPPAEPSGTFLWLEEEKSKIPEPPVCSLLRSAPRCGPSSVNSRDSRCTEG